MIVRNHLTLGGCDMREHLYIADFLEWQRRILRTNSEFANNRCKLLSLALPDILEHAYTEEKDNDDGTFTDVESNVHLRVRISDVHLRLGWERHTIGRTLKELNNNGIVSYRFFQENWNGRIYNLSYVFPFDKLWDGDIRSIPGNEHNRGNRQKNYRPVCIKCESTFQKKTGGIEYECLSCGNKHVYYPE